MKTKDLIISELIGGHKLTTKNLSDRLGKSPAGIHNQLMELVQACYVTEILTSPKTYCITVDGENYAKSDEFGKTSPSKPSSQPAPEGLSIGVFTTGELHISVGSKTLRLTKAQSAELVEFVCALPSKMFSDQPRPTMASLPGRVVRSE